MNSRRDSVARSRLSRRPPDWLVVAVLATAGLNSSFMFTLVVPIQAQLPALLSVGRDDTSWVVTSTLLTAAVLTPISGRLGDMYGKKRIVVVLLCILITGSLVAALSPSLVGLIVGRALQGAATGVIPLGISILRDILEPDRLDSASALVSATLGVGGALGLPISAAVSQFGDWRALFWGSAGLGLTVLVLIVAVVPESVLRTGKRFDVIGAAGLIAGLVALLLGISRGNTWGWSSPVVLALLIGGAIVLAGWAVFELRVRDPLLDLRVAARRPVIVTNLASLAIGFALFTTSIIFPQQLETPVAFGGFGLTLLEAALVCMPLGLIMMMISPIAGRMSRRFGPRIPLIIGVISITCGYAFALATGNDVWQIVVTNCLTGIGVGFGFAAMPGIIMRSVPANETGASNGLNTLFRSLGQAVAAAVVATVLAQLSVSSGGNQIPTAEGYQLAIIIGAGASLASVVLALFIPRGTRPRSAIPPES